jgi:hypothetical protein
MNAIVVILMVDGTQIHPHRVDVIYHAHLNQVKCAVVNRLILFILQVAKVRIKKIEISVEFENLKKNIFFT